MRYIIKSIIKISLSVFWVFPVRNRKILFISYGGQQYSCNPKYLSEFINNDNNIPCEISWAFKEPQRFKWLKKNNIKVVKYGSLRYLKAILTAKVVITNNSISSYLPIRDSQTVINTWHGGGAYKKVVSDNNDVAKNTIKETAKLYDIFLSTGKRNSELMIKETFGHSGKILEVGFPRNDMFFRNTDNIKNKVYQYFNLNSSDKIVLYAPTFRESAEEGIYDIDTVKLNRALEKRFGGNWIIMIRAHHCIKDEFCFEDNKNIVDATDYTDMQELLCSAELLITDYSSCIWDFSLTYKPTILFAKDIDSYKKERDFHIPIEKWYFPIAKTNDELMRHIASYDETENIKLIKRHFEEFGSFEKGEATELVANEIKKILS